MSDNSPPQPTAPQADGVAASPAASGGGLRGLKAFRTAVQKVAALQALAGDSIVAEGSEVFLKLGAEGTERDWTRGIVMSVIDEASSDGGVSGRSPVQKRTLLVRTASAGEVRVDPSDGLNFHFNRQGGWQSSHHMNDLLEISDSHPSTVAMSIRAFAEDASVESLNLGSRECGLLKTTADSSNVRLAALDRMSTVVCGASMSERVITSVVDAKVRAMHLPAAKADEIAVKVRHVLTICNAFFGSFVLEVGITAAGEVVTRVPLAELPGGAKALAEMKNRRVDAPLTAAILALGGSVPFVENIFRGVAMLIGYSPVNMRGSAATEQLNDLLVSVGLPPKPSAAYVSQAPGLSFDDAKICLIQQICLRAAHILFKKPEIRVFTTSHRLLFVPRPAAASVGGTVPPASQVVPPEAEVPLALRVIHDLISKSFVDRRSQQLTTTPAAAPPETHDGGPSGFEFGSPAACESWSNQAMAPVALLDAIFEQANATASLIDAAKALEAWRQRVPAIVQSSGVVAPAGSGPKDRDVLVVQHASRRRGVPVKYAVSKLVIAAKCHDSIGTPGFLSSAIKDIHTRYVNAASSYIFAFDASDAVALAEGKALAAIAATCLFSLPLVPLPLDELSAMRCLINHPATESISATMTRLWTSLGIDSFHLQFGDRTAVVSVQAERRLRRRFKRFKESQLVHIQAALRSRASLIAKRRLLSKRKWMLAHAFLCAKVSSMYTRRVSIDVLKRVWDQSIRNQNERILSDERRLRWYLIRDEEDAFTFIRGRSGSFMGPVFVRMQCELAALELKKRAEVLSEYRAAIGHLLDWQHRDQVATLLKPTRHRPDSNDSFSALTPLSSTSASRRSDRAAREAAAIPTTMVPPHATTAPQIVHAMDRLSTDEFFARAKLAAQQSAEHERVRTYITEQSSSLRVVDRTRRHHTKAVSVATSHAISNLHATAAAMQRRDQEMSMALRGDRLDVTFTRYWDSQFQSGANPQQPSTALWPRR